MLSKYETNQQGKLHAGAKFQESCFVTLFKSHIHTHTHTHTHTQTHTHTDAAPEICNRPAEYPPPGEHFWGTAFVCQKTFIVGLSPSIKIVLFASMNAL